MQRNDGLKTAVSEPSPVGKADSLGSRIPRATGFKRAANISSQKEARGAPELRSSIPTAAHRHSAEQLPTAVSVKQNETPASGIRVNEKPRGPRPRPCEEQGSEAVFEPLKGTEPTADLAPPPDSSSSVSSWDFGDGEEPERPATVFTGEYRSRTFKIPGRSTPGPTLRVASSAENLIMGKEGQEQCEDTASRKTIPVKIKEKLFPGTPKDRTPDSKSSIGNTPIARNLCRPQASLDSISRRDFSGKEMSISRKPVGKPSLTSLFSPVSRSQSEEAPVVPRIPDQYFPSPGSKVSGVSSKAAGSVTPGNVKATPEQKSTPCNQESETTPAPETVVKGVTIHPHPPRTSSLRALSEFPSSQELEHDPEVAPWEEPSKSGTGLRRNVTFSDFVPLDTVQEPVFQSDDKPKLPESKSNHFLGGFRNIFKSRSGATEKEHSRKEDIQVSEHTKENYAISDKQDTKKANPVHNTLAKSSKTKTRLSAGVGWGKASRNPKSADKSPATPTPAFPRLLAPPHQDPESDFPSFARPTKSTRTKATSGTRSLSTPDAHSRRPHVRTASTGSPLRVNQGSKRTAGSLLALSSQDKSDDLPVSLSDKAVMTVDGLTDGVPKNVEAVRRCLETLCEKVGEAATPQERDRHIRLALTLQQQLGDYQSVEKVALEVEALAKEKRMDRKVAEDLLNTTLAEVQAQLKED
ncbi:hypothetical protein BJX61DRAFT_403181 [Aspergillus egyptiacus]|nr:hypothetical protein BJX61DRAFT_403181 [Aspergillus egyptiacus]